MTDNLMVFVVDDDPGSLQRISSLVSKAGLPVRSFESPSDFLSQYSAEQGA